jgi:hypothetical protein
MNGRNAQRSRMIRSTFTIRHLVALISVETAIYLQSSATDYVDAPVHKVE